MAAVYYEIQLTGALFTFLLGLAFGSFLNLVLTRLPNNESIVTPASHCRNCTHALAWWENIPLLSWLILKGRCHQCQTRISPRYPLIELSIAILWTLLWLKFTKPITADIFNLGAITWITLVGYTVLTWLLVVLSTLDAEHFWLPDVLTLPGIALGIGCTALEARNHDWALFGVYMSASILLPAAVILIIRLLYWLIRRKEGMGLGDAKLMAMLGAWLGLIGALETFAVAILAATTAALIWLVILVIRKNTKEWARLPLPIGTFLCLATLPEIFYPNWLWNWYSRVFLP